MKGNDVIVMLGNSKNRGWLRILTPVPTSTQ